MRAILLLLISALGLSACATNVPDAIREPPVPDLSLAIAREKTTSYIGTSVRWGGRIAAIENRADETWVDIVAREIDSSGRPRETDVTLGRFIARVSGFLDPAIYTKAREVTVAGRIAGELTRSIGEHPYRYIMVKADSFYLWRPRVSPADPYDDPWHDRFWPLRPYPRFGPHPYW